MVYEHPFARKIHQAVGSVTLMTGTGVNVHQVVHGRPLDDKVLIDTRLLAFRKLHARNGRIDKQMLVRQLYPCGVHAISRFFPIQAGRQIFVSLQIYQRSRRPSVISRAQLSLYANALVTTDEPTRSHFYHWAQRFSWG